MKRMTSEEQKRVELDILIAFDHFCREHSLRYQIAYGTLLGAVRHSGFIPWDDDIDVVMPRQDYESFYTLFPKQGQIEYLKLVSYRDKSSIYPFYKIIDTRTHVDELTVNPKYTTGAWIDIFPVDGLPADDAPFAINRKTQRYYDFVVANPKCGTTPLRRLIKACCYPIARHINVYKLADKLDQAASSTPITPAADIGVVVWGFGSKERMPYSMLESTELLFEGHSVFAPLHHDEILTRQYGDYMQLPPVEKRKPHICHCYWV